VSETATFWLIIAVLAVGTWAMRAFPIMLHGHVALPTWAERLLRYVPVAALTALVVPGALYLKVDGEYTFASARLLAAGVALVVAARTKNVIWTLGAGMVTLWIAQLFL